MAATLQPMDIVKKPTKVLMKFLNGLIGGAGASVQEAMASTINSYFPKSPSGIIPALEWFLASLGAGAIEQEQLSAFLNGVGNGAAKDAFKALYAKFMPNAPLGGMFKEKTIPSGSQIPSQGTNIYGDDPF
jgi:hypothetical protein